MNNFKFLNGFDIETYVNPNTPDEIKTKMRADHLVKVFSVEFSSYGLIDKNGVLKLVSFDKVAKKLYSDINKEFNELHNFSGFFLLEGLSIEERLKVSADSLVLRKALKDYGDTLNLISKEAKDRSKEALRKRNEILGKLSDFSKVSLVTIDNVPADLKTPLLSLDGLDYNIKSSEILDNYRRSLVRMIKENGGKFPRDFDPL